VLVAPPPPLEESAEQRLFAQRAHLVEKGLSSV